MCVREGKTDEAAAKLAEAEPLRPTLSGTCGDAAFTGFRDLDDLTAGVFEVFTSQGNYYWVPFEAVESIEFRTPERPRDLLWRSTRMSVRNGPDGEVYLPALYPGTHTAGADDLRLGRRTEYTDGRPVRGCGLREFLVGEDARTAPGSGNADVRPQLASEGQVSCGAWESAPRWRVGLT